VNENPWTTSPGDDPKLCTFCEGHHPTRACPYDDEDPGPDA
jgi:hypothetical protein